MFACNMCSSADPASDTVKVNFNAMPAEDAKENQPGANQVPFLLADDALKAKEKAAREEEEAEEQRRRAEAEAELMAQQQRLLEQRRREEEEAALRQAAQEAEAQRRFEAEERRAAADAAAKRQEELARRQAAEEAEAARRKAEEEEAEQERERQLQEQMLGVIDRHYLMACDKLKLEAFLKEHDYSGPNTKRTKMFKTKYPLHTAVKINDPNMVRILLAAGADGSAKNSAGQTPAQLAKKSDKQGSHADLLSALDGF